MDADVDLSEHVLCVALTRPAMIYGVSLNYLGINVGVVMSTFILCKSLWIVLLIMPLHVVGVSLCAIDSRIFDLLLGYLRVFNAANQDVWRCQSYEPF